MKKLAIIIGGSSGIGYSICKSLSEDFDIINFSRHKAVGFKNIKTDVGDYKSIIKSFSKIDIPYVMVYCAGFVKPEGLLELNTNTWEQTIKINLTGAFYCTQEFVKRAKNTGGKIVYIASTAGTRASPGWSAYASSKSGLISFGLSMSEELKEYKIKVYIVSPGRCATPLRKILAPNEDQSKIMQPDELSKFVKYIVMNDELLDGQSIRIRSDIV
jgi:NAD(P)-dependent dehydrogenase (short-subunit alcohol dehydrogenase family)